jgi:hypothetical protein
MIKPNNHQELPKNFRDVLQDIERCREKSARQKYLLDLSEGLLIHVCAFVLGEYKYSGISSLELEKLLLKNNRNLSFGTYLLFLRSTMEVLNKGGYKSKLNNLVWENNEWPEVKRFEVLFDAVKGKIDNLEGLILEAEANKVALAPQGKTNVIKFFDKVVNLRNRVAHPHKVVKDKEVNWPHNEDYFNAINPPLEKALMFLIEQLHDAWSYRFYRVAESESNTLQIESEDSSEYEEVSFSHNLEKGIRVLVNENFDLIVSDWKVLLQASEEALAFIEKENENLRKMASVEELKEQIVVALDDEQISLEEFKFFESISRVKLGLSSAEVKSLVIDVAKSMNIEDPFPEVDKRFIEAIDQAILSKSFNDFVLRLMGEQYGVDAEMFEQIVNERAEELNIDAAIARQSTQVSFNPKQLDAFVRMHNARNWIKAIHTLNKGVGDSNYKITGDVSVAGSKEFLHKQAFSDVLHFVKSKLNEFSSEGSLEWDAHVNQWQIGAMTSYIWTCFYPKNVPTKSFIALHVSVYQDGSVAIGLLPDWKDYSKINNYQLLKQVTSRVLDGFAKNYAKEISKYDNLFLWNYNNSAFDTLSNAVSEYNWVLREDYSFEQIQFMLLPEELANNPQAISTSFDISFNLFNGIIPEIINDYSLISSEIEDSFALNFDSSTNALTGLVELVSTFRNAHAVSVNAGSISAQLINGFVGYTLESTEEKQSVKFNLQLYFDYIKRRFCVSLKFSVTDGFNMWHSSIANALARFEMHQSDVETFYRKGILLIRYSQVEIIDLMNNASAFVSNTLECLMSEFAQESVNPLGFQYSAEHFKSNQAKADALLDALSERVEPFLSNKRRAERKIFHQLKYSDCVSMNENHKSQTLRWGFNFKTSQYSPFVSIQLESDTSNFQLTQDLKAYAHSNEGWEITSSDAISSKISEEWCAWKEGVAVVTSSSSWNRKHGPEQGKLNLEEGIANWSAKANDLKQCIEVDLGEKKLVQKIAIQGRYNREQWVTKFRIMVSLDGKKFEEIGTGFDGNTDQKTIVEVVLEPNPVARVVRIVPLEWHGHISMRFDVQAKEFREQSFEMKIENFAESLEESEALGNKMAEVISDIQKTFPGKFGLVKQVQN